MFYVHGIPRIQWQRSVEMLRLILTVRNFGIRPVHVGDALSLLCDAVKMADLTSSLLCRNRDLFTDNLPVPTEWYM